MIQMHLDDLQNEFLHYLRHISKSNALKSLLQLEKTLSS